MKNAGATVGMLVWLLGTSLLGTFTITGNGTATIRSFQASDFNLTLTTNTIARTVTGAVNNQTTNSGRVYVNRTNALIFYDQQFVPIATGTYGTNGVLSYVIASSNPSAATINSSGYMTMVGAGSTVISYTYSGVPPFKVQYPLTMSSNAATGSSTFTNWQSGLLPYDMVEEVDQRATDTNAATDGATNIYSSYVYQSTNGTYTSATRSTNFFLHNCDWSGVPAAGTGQHNGALITPQDIVEAAHYGYAQGAYISFFDSTNGVHIVTTTTSQVNIAGTDIALQHLSSPLPSNVKYYKIFPTAYGTNVVNYCPDYNLNYWPIVYLLKGMSVQLMDAWPTVPYPSTGGYTNELYCTVSTATNRAPYSIQPYPGVSGSPAFAIVNGEPILVGCCHTTSSFSWLPSNMAAIQYALTNTLGSSYTATTWTNSFAATSTNGMVTSFPTY